MELDSGTRSSSPGPDRPFQRLIRGDVDALERVKEVRSLSNILNSCFFLL